MNPHDDRVEAIFHAAVEISDRSEREALIHAECDDELALEMRVRRLIALHEDASGLLGSAERSPEIGEQMARLKPEEVGERIGPYKLLQQIGEGGFGVVWMAEQEQPVRRRVALKIIKMGMDTKEVIARFEQERQALAMMEHPNIAKVFDAGATQYGRPFFVMELVRGVRITDYCDEQQLPTEERLALFIRVCQAVQHAHQKGIIHRDLKPSNILVTINDGEAVPKVIDFGVAKATQGRLTEATLFTQFEQMVGTPLYMSPEQAELTSLDIDTRSDIYSLGVLLYELLTGRTPIDTTTMAQAGMDEIRRIIREVDPPRPSARVKTLDGNELTTAAQRRHTDAAKLPGALRGDLDWIVMKCLEKDRKRRYDTANGLALDLQRHLANEIITARPPTARYLLGKLIRRNKIAFAASAAIAASLVIGIAASVWQAVRATSAEKAAMATLDELRATAPAFVEQARGLAAKEHFDEAIEKLDYALKLRPDAAEFLLAKGDLLQCQLKLAEAAAIYREALRVNPGLARAEASAKLSDELLAAPSNADGKLTRESLAKLHVAMQRQQRPAAELMPVARQLGEEKKLIVEYWLDRLKDLPVSSEIPIEKRLTLGDDGRLALDLSGTKIIDLSALAGAPLALLDLSQCKELSDLTPIRGLELSRLDLSGTGVTDLSPLREMHSLESLDFSDTLISDLSAIAALRLKVLRFQGCPVRDLAPIRGMPLTTINLRESRVSDLSPLVGMSITQIDLTGLPVLDFTPLAQLPLEKCYLQSNRITDLSVLRGKPLKELALWGCSEARNYAAIAEIKTLELLLLPSQYRSLPDDDFAAIRSLRDHPALRQIGAEIMDKMGYAATGSKEVFWQDWDREQSFVPALRSRKIDFSLLKLPSGTYRLQSQSQPVGDLSFLKGAPISELVLYKCQIADLTPIRDLPLEYLNIGVNPVTDLGPLHGRQIKWLSLAETNVSDISPLKGLPLRELYLNGCDGLNDVSVLARIPTLEKVTVPIQARNIEALRALPNLQMLAFQMTDTYPGVPTSSAQEFWRQLPQMVWGRALDEAGIKYRAYRKPDGLWSVTINDPQFHDLSVFRGSTIGELILDDTSVTDLAPLVGLPLKSLSLDGTPVADLTPLGEIALAALSLRKTRVTDLSPLRSAPLCKALTHLWLYRTKVTDFSPVAACTALTVFDATETTLPDLEPLRGRQLREIYLASTRVRDISILAGMPLERIFFDNIDVADVSPLLKCRALKDVIVPKAAERLEALRQLPRLERISYTFSGTDSGPSKTAAEFWMTFNMEERIGRADALLDEGRMDDALSLLADASTDRPDDTILAVKLAALQVWFGKDADHDATRARMLKWAAGTNTSVDAERVAKLATLRPVSDPAQRDAALVLARRSLDLDPGSNFLGYFQLARGMSAYRSGQYSEADEALTAAVGAAPRLAEPFLTRIQVTAGFYRAMSRFQQGKPAEARELFAAAESRMKPFPADDRRPFAEGATYDDMVFWLACKEARALIALPPLK